MKKSFQTEMDDTQQAVSQIVCLCTTIALHQEFGVGKTRLDRITAVSYTHLTLPTNREV